MPSKIIGRFRAFATRISKEFDRLFEITAIPKTLIIQKI